MRACACRVSRRGFCLVAGLTLLILQQGAFGAAPDEAPKDKGKDALQKEEEQVGLETFLKAHSEGQADKYKGSLIVGSGPNFNGNTEAAGQVMFILSLFVVSKKGTLTPLRTFKANFAAQVSGEPFLRVVVKGQNLRRKPNESLGQIYYFAGTFEGDYQTVQNNIRVEGQEFRSDKAPVLVRSKVSYSGPIKLKEDERDAKEKLADVEDKAADLLKKAKEVLEKKNVTLARIRLQTIVNEYRNTKAAAEAQKLLKTLPK